jgi:uncharacterized membrane protein YfcA
VRHRVGATLRETGATTPLHGARADVQTKQGTKGMRDRLETLVLGVFGITGTMGGAAVSLQVVEQWMRLASLTVGLIVGVWTIYRLWKGKKTE